MNGHREISEDHARLFERDGAAPVVLQQWRSFEAAKHDAVVPVQGNFAKHLRRRDTGGEDRAGYPRLTPADPPRSTGLEQFYDLTGRPRGDVRRRRLHPDFLSQRSLHCQRPYGETPASQKGTGLCFGALRLLARKNSTASKYLSGQTGIAIPAGPRRTYVLGVGMTTTVGSN
ncbi:hypothetical protein [Bradyrhizobium sp. AUGA SZCCT0042]|uniref:hypothetical protein n=1 Tax=Bradyrhizobium sp. AUGA SZCCT0042 TaxID=2807651 RepID=UPI001BA86A10|nr:hypothetical protein [Bradyrhizobium sp. AUGA SZCCT0042]MBR1301294.1 hypothetical protein [Bradyrhizobium sp. AUGA SZCCT0042]